MKMYDIKERKLVTEQSPYVKQLEANLLSNYSDKVYNQAWTTIKGGKLQWYAGEGFGTKGTAAESPFAEFNIPDYTGFVNDNAKAQITELTSATSGLSLAQLVASRAAIQMLTLTDARKLCRVEASPPRGGMVYHFQKVVAVAFTGGGGSSDTLTEGTDLNAQDMTLTDITATLQVFAGRTDISDIAARQAAVDLSQIIGTAHGNALVRAANNNIYNAIKGATTTSYVNAGTANSGTEDYKLAWAELFKARQKVLSARGIPNSVITSPYELYNLLINNITSVQFYAAMSDFIHTGRMPVIMGMDVYEDPVWGETFTGTTGEKFAAVLWGGEAVGWVSADDVHTEVQRWAPQVGSRIVSSLTGISGVIMEPWISLIKHA